MKSSEQLESRKSVLDMTDDEFRAYIDGVERRLREPYGAISDRAWELVGELRKRKMAGKSSFLGYPLLCEGLGAFAEKVVQLYPDKKAKALASMIVSQALTDFVVTSEPFRAAMRALLDAERLAVDENGSGVVDSEDVARKGAKAQRREGAGRGRDGE